MFMVHVYLKRYIDLAVRNSMLQEGPYLQPFCIEGNFHLYLYHFQDSIFRRLLNLFFMNDNEKL